ncbi:MAG TPA: AmmeMemoRadiSam system protein B [Thiotrichales bacterium]|nr:AmmeMemoRadiSam system protein B [Thiotrichales bacterium]
MSRIRYPAVAGMFYPADPDELADQIRHFMAAAPKCPVIPKAIVVPHAGYPYSGAVAASAYACLEQARGQVSRVILLGPAHRVPVRGLAASSATHFQTPLGAVPVDVAAVESLLDLPQVRVMDAAHAEEHSLEVHLPFLQMVLGDFAVVPLVVGEAAPGEVAEVLDRLWGGPETLIVISSDLSHYLPYEAARRIDSRTAEAIEELHPEAIGYDQACGRNPLNGLLLAARRHGLRAQTLDLRNSGDTAGPRNQVVGYGAWIFH